MTKKAPKIVPKTGSVEAEAANKKAETQTVAVGAGGGASGGGGSNPTGGALGVASGGKTPGTGHNSKKIGIDTKMDDLIDKDGGAGVTGNRIKSFIERVERLEEEKTALAEDIKEIYGEAKATGFDVPTIRKIVKYRKMDIQKRRESDDLFELYKSAIGME